MPILPTDSLHGVDSFTRIANLTTPWTESVHDCYPRGVPKARYIRDEARHFGEIIRRLRLERGWTIVRLAQRSGMHANSLSMLEKGGNMPSLDAILLLAIVFDADPAEWVREIAQRFYAKVGATPGAGSDPN